LTRKKTPDEIIPPGRRDRPLRPKQLAFRDAYMAQPKGEKNPRQAALDAGYSPATAAEQGRRLLLHPKVREEMMMSDPRRAIEIANIDAAWVLHQLATLWETPLAALFDEDGCLRPIHELSTEAQRLITSFEVEEITTYSKDARGKKIATVNRTGKLKLMDRFKVLRGIGDLTAVNAYGTRNAAEQADSVADLMRAMTKKFTEPGSNRVVEIPSLGAEE
jgi:phage terminase small subunit